MNVRRSQAASKAGTMPAASTVLSPDEVTQLMGPLGPFEPAPRVAVAVSGGADSLALCLILDDWAALCGGRVVALTVDHGLRPGSAAEARRVARRLGPLGIEHHVLTWKGAKPTSNRQAAARAARYGLLGDWCAGRGVLHLATAHHREDQAETLLLRLGRGSGLDGLAAMPAVSETDGVRLLRPLLAVPKARLEATLTARGVHWDEDPSNADMAFRRVQIRRLLATVEEGVLDATRLAAAVKHLGRARAALERDASRLLARTVAIDPAGFAWLDPEPVAAAPREIGLRALSRVVRAVGGRPYTPRLDRLERLYARLPSGPDRGATLGGCRILRRGGRLLLIVREAAGPPSIPLRPGQSLRWDGRFDVRVVRTADPSGALTLAPLGVEGWKELARSARPELADAVPAAARGVVPGLFDAAGLVEAPQFCYQRAPSQGKVLKYCSFAPLNALTAATFTVA